MGVSENGVYPLMVVPLGKRINYQIFVVPYIQTNPNILSDKSKYIGYTQMLHYATKIRYHDERTTAENQTVKVHLGRLKGNHM